MWQQLNRFGLIGLGASLIHYLVAASLIVAYVAPLLANFIAFSIAFLFSYWGHRQITFQVSHLSHRQTLPRFLGVAVLGFALNQVLLALSLRYTDFSPLITLPIIIFIVAVNTFIFSKWFAFKH